MVTLLVATIIYLSYCYVFVAGLQDEEGGGISDRPDDMVDVYHTFFGIAGLSLIGCEGLPAIDPVYALPVVAMERLRQKQGAQT